jgi:two-component system, sensor histidine kinase and response regulator
LGIGFRLIPFDLLADNWKSPRSQGGLQTVKKAKSHNPGSGSGRTAGILNREVALARLDGDLDMLASLADIMVSELPEMMRAVQEALDAGDGPKLEHAAHRLKGSVDIFGAQGAAAAALQLEKIGRSRDLSAAGGVRKVLEEEVRRLEPALLELRRELQHS